MVPSSQEVQFLGWEDMKIIKRVPPHFFTFEFGVRIKVSGKGLGATGATHKPIGIASICFLWPRLYPSVLWGAGSL